jgi:hypothetical protein
MITTVLLTCLQGAALPPDSDDVAALKAAFPAFAAVPGPTVTFWLTRAARVVNDGWLEEDRTFGRHLLACHLMTEQGLGVGAEAEAFAAGAGGFTTMRSGSLSLTRDASAHASAGAYGSTQYGRQFAVLLRQNRGGPRVTDTGSLPLPWPLTYPHGAA